MNSPLRSILVFQTWGMGDMIMATPMLGALRKQAPQARITVAAGASGAADVVAGSHLCDDALVVFEGKTNYRLLGTFLLRCMVCRYDAALLCVGMSPRIAQVLTKVGRYKIVAGASSPVRKSCFTHWVEHDPGKHRVQTNLDILRTLFPDAAEEPLYFPVDGAARARVEGFWAQTGLNGHTVIGLHPGSGTAGSGAGREKRIPLARCLDCVRLLLAQAPDVRILVFLGWGEGDLKTAFATLDPRVKVADGLDMRAVAALIGRTRVLLAGDTGLGHVAAALGVPVVSLFGPTSPRWTRPWGGRNVPVQAEGPLAPACMPCYGTPLYGRCPHDLQCLNAIDYPQVVREVARLAGAY
jgi:ADP-heptose:LPS heptosyltransferase